MSFLLNSYILGAPPVALPFIFTIDTQQPGASDDSFQLPLWITGTYDFVVDFGDGNQANITSWDDLEASHNYAAPGVYQITITGQCTRISFPDWPGNFAQVKLISVDQWGDIGVTDAQYAFNACPNLTTIATSFWPGVIGVYAIFASCSALTEIPAGLFNDCTVCDVYTQVFDSCGSLTTIPAGLFANSNATYFNSVFSGCNNLTSISADTFAGCTAALDMSSAFSGSGLTEIPAGLLDDCAALQFATSMFDGCAMLVTVPANLFGNSPNLQYANYCFQGCTSLTSIPATMFSGCSGLDNLSYAFYDNALTGIPIGLLDDSTVLTTINNMFMNCTSLVAIPSGLFIFNTALSNVEQLFENCSSIVSIPDNLFSNATTLASFLGVFKGCTALKAIPVNTFGTNSNCTNFGDTFYGCSSLNTINGGVFDGLGATSISFNSTFRDCIALSSTPTGLFDSNSVNDFNALFMGCTSLTTVTDAGNWNVTDLTTAELMFNGVTLDTTDYDDLLIGWAGQSVQSVVTFDAGNSTYTSGGAAEAARDVLVINNSWIITDGGPV